MSWQPISTAQKSAKKPILVWNGNAMHTAVWCRVENNWRLCLRTLLTVLTVPGKVTHWMELPAPPDAP